MEQDTNETPCTYMYDAVFISFFAVPSSRHIYQPMMDSLTFLARYLGDGEQRRELLLKTLQQFIQQGIMAKKASDSTQSTHKVCPFNHHLIVMRISCDVCSNAGYFKFIQSGVAPTNYCRGKLIKFAIYNAWRTANYIQM